MIEAAALILAVTQVALIVALFRQNDLLVKVLVGRHSALGPKVAKRVRREAAEERASDVMTSLAGEQASLVDGVSEDPPFLRERDRQPVGLDGT